MATTVLFLLFGVAAVVFMTRVFIAFCMDRPKERCRILRIVNPAAEQEAKERVGFSQLHPRHWEEELVGASTEVFRS
jgi:hypothetical protein